MNFKRSVESLESPASPGWAAMLPGFWNGAWAVALSSFRPDGSPLARWALISGLTLCFPSVRSPSATTTGARLRAIRDNTVSGRSSRGSGGFSLAAASLAPSGGGCGSSPRWVRIFSITSPSQDGTR